MQLEKNIRDDLHDSHDSRIGRYHLWLRMIFTCSLDIGHPVCFDGKRGSRPRGTPWSAPFLLGNEQEAHKGTHEGVAKGSQR